MKKNKQLQLDILSIAVSLVVITGRYLGPVVIIFILQRFGTDIQYNLTNLAVMYGGMAVYSLAKTTLNAIGVVREEL